MQEFTLINKNRDRIKIFKPFEDVSKPSPTINAIEIKYACVYKRSSKPVIKGSRVESIEDARKEYKQSLEEGQKNINNYWRTDGRRQVYLKDIFKKILILLALLQKLAIITS